MIFHQTKETPHVSSLLTTELMTTQKKFLKVDGTNMTGNLNLNNNKIINLQTDYRDSKSAVNVDFMQDEITKMRDLVTQKIYESQIINSGQKRDAFRYLMEDTDESSSENNIEVLSIVDFPNSPHQINKKAYQLKLLFEKGSPYQYRSRLGFNLYKLPVGYLTIILRNRAKYILILSRRGRRPSGLNQEIFRKIEQDNCFIIQQIPIEYHFQNEKNYGSMIKTLKVSNT